MNLRLFDRPWLILPQTHAVMAEVFWRRLVSADSPGEPGASGNGVTEENGPNGTRIVSFSGVMMKRPSADEKKYCDAVDTDEIAAAVQRASSDAAALVLNISSPGGEVTGIEELGATIAGAKIPTFSFTDSLMASAAFWVGSQADAVYSTPSAQVGSIGVYAPVIDISEALKKFGVKVELFKAGKYKAAGFPGQPLTEEQRALFQSRVDGIHEQFKAAVTSKRKQVSAESMEGQVFLGREAAGRGLVSGLETSLDGVVARAARAAVAKN